MKKSQMIFYRLAREVNSLLWQHNRNWLGIMVGPTGSGKSYGSVSFGDEVSDDFSIKRCVIWNPIQFVKTIGEDVARKGDFLVFEEGGVNLGSRTWQSINNRVINYILQTFRHKNIAVLFNVPNIGFIDVQARNLFHAYIETKHIYRKHGFLKARYMYIDQRPDSTDFIRKYPRIVNNGKVMKVKSVLIPKPRPTLIREYEKAKKEFSRTLAIDLLKLIEKEGGNNEPKKPTHKCLKCGYEWIYRGKSEMPMCPGCLKRTTTTNPLSA